VLLKHGTMDKVQHSLESTQLSGFRKATGMYRETLQQLTTEDAAKSRRRNCVEVSRGVVFITP
jgi:hypothetical protein